MTDQADKLRALMESRAAADLEEKRLAYENATPSRVITISAGKNATGKSSLAINLAIQFVRVGKKCLVIDADLKNVNTSKLLGTEPEHGLKDMMEGKRAVKEILIEGPGGIQFISGGAGFSKLLDISDNQKLNTAESNRQISRFIEKLTLLDNISDIILIDTGAGMQNRIVDFVGASDETILMITPEADSITGAYALIKRVKEQNTDLPEFNIVANRTESMAVGDEIFGKLERAISKFLHTPLNHVGTLPYYSNLIKAGKSKRPVMLMYPDSPVATNIENIVTYFTDENERNISKAGFKGFMQKLLIKINNN